MIIYTALHTDDLTDMLAPILVPEDCNYVGVFLTLDCNLSCSYCINRFGVLHPERRVLTGAEWVRGLNRIMPRPDLPLTLQGGEPTLHPDFYAIVQGIRRDLPIDILTNLTFDPEQFMQNIPPERLKRDAPYASLRVSYHPEMMKIETLAAKVLKLQHAGYSIGIWGVLHPLWEHKVSAARDYCLGLGIDFRTKEFLGVHDGVLHGRFTYPDACSRRDPMRVLCRTTELLIGPGGDVYRCHSDLYENQEPVGHILDPAFTIDTGFRPCSRYGYCNPCDVKMKTNRFQVNGHTSVEILTGQGSAPAQDDSPEGPTIGCGVVK